MLSLLAAVTLRDIWYLRLATRPGELLSVPMGDSNVYLQVARELATSGSAARSPFYWSPLYSLFLALWSGDASSAVIVLQMLTGLLTLWLVYLGGRRLGSTRAGFIAALVLALYSPFLMFQTKLLPVTFATLFAVLGIWLAIHALQTQPARPVTLQLALRWLLSGISFGLSSLLMPQLLLAPVLLCLALLLIRVSRKPLVMLLLLGGTAVPVLPVTIRNAIAGRDFVPVSSSAGFNLHLGWNPGATGLIGWPPEMFEFRKDGKTMTSVTEQQEFQRLYAEQQTGRGLSPSQVSAFWTRRALQFIFGRPAKSAALLLRKFWLTLTGFEFANSYYPELERRLAPPLRTAVLPWAVLLGLSLAGVILTWSRRRALLPVYVLPAAILLSLLVFFVNSRYRLPAIPMLCVLAGLGIDAALKRRRAWIVLLAVAVTVALLSGVALRAAFAETIRFDEGFGWRNLNVNAQRLGRPDLALDLLDRAAHLTQQSPRNARTAAQYDDLAQSLAGLGNTLVDCREPALARRAFDRAIELNPRYGPAWLMRGVVELDAGEPVAALRDAEQVLRLAPEFVNALVLKSRSLAQLGDRAAADSTARVAARLDPAEPMVQGLLRELNLTP
jgi:tetratricopeptide (TPR) repeat protein